MTNRIFFNGNIYTGDINNVFAEAIYIEGDKIKFVGSNKEVQKYKLMDEEIIDLNGKTVVPGFIDSHLHLLEYAKSLNKVNLSSCKSIDEVIEVSKKFIIDNHIDSKKWLVGFGWNHENFGCKKMPTKYDLDKISKDIPIFFKRACMHVSTCNSKVLEIAGVTKDTVVEGGEVDVVNGDTTGILKENAAYLIEKYIPMNSTNKKELVLKALETLSTYGITGIHTDDLGKDSGGLEMIDVYKELDMEDKLNVRVCIQSRINNFDEAKNYIDIGFNKCAGSKNFNLVSLKLLTDGSLGGQTAAMNEPYENSTETGIVVFTQDEIDKIIELAHVNDVPVVMHGIGDRTIDMAIKGFEKSIKKYPEHKVRHGIIHCQITSNKALEKIKENNILAYIQPIFVATDYKIVEKRVGKERAKYSYNWKTLNDSGVTLAFGTDAPVESPNPYENIYCAVTRKDLNGMPEGGFLPEQCLTVEECIKAYTINGAYASYEENIKGSLEVGKLADFAVLSDNIFEVSKDKIKDINCIMTVKGGNTIFKK